MLIPVFAAVIGVHMEMNTVSAFTPQWVHDNGNWFYYHSPGQIYYGWQKVGNNYYYFRQWANYPSPGPAGSIVLGWQLINSQWYCFEQTTDPRYGGGYVMNGWKYVSNGWYYFQDYFNDPAGHGGLRLTGWIQAGLWYYLNSSGIMQTGWQTLSGRQYYFKPGNTTLSGKNGQMYTGWNQISNTYYYFEEGGSGPTVSPYKGRNVTNKSVLLNSYSGGAVFYILDGDPWPVIISRTIFYDTDINIRYVKPANGIQIYESYISYFGKYSLVNFEYPVELIGITNLRYYNSNNTYVQDTVKKCSSSCHHITPIPKIFEEYTYYHWNPYKYVNVGNSIKITYDVSMWCGSAIYPSSIQTRTFNWSGL